MKPNCEVCGCKDPVAILTNSALGTYEACQKCMDAGTRPPCESGCGHPSELIVNGKRTCSACYDAAQEARRVEVEKQMETRQRQLQAEVQAQINAAVAKALGKALKLKKRS